VTFDPTLLALVFGVMVVAGTVKGALGIGLPAVAMSVLPLFIDPAIAVALLTLPILLTNAQQVITGEGWRKIVPQFYVAGGLTFATTFLVSQFLPKIPSPVVSGVIGVTLVLFAVSAMVNIRLPVSKSLGWQIAVGLSSGLIGGLSAVKTPIMIYCTALNLSREEFIVSAGFLFFSGGVGLLLGLSLADVFNPSLLSVSIGAVIMAFAGFQIGALIRRRINATLFRKLLLWTMLILGLRMVLLSLV
jgi:uncharacterized protein